MYSKIKIPKMFCELNILNSKVVWVMSSHTVKQTSIRSQLPNIVGAIQYICNAALGTCQMHYWTFWSRSLQQSPKIILKCSSMVRNNFLFLFPQLDKSLSDIEYPSLTGWIVFTCALIVHVLLSYFILTGLHTVPKENHISITFPVCETACGSAAAG